MKLAFDASVVSSKRWAAIVWLLSAAACVAGWPLAAVGERLALATGGVVIGAVLARGRWWLVRHSADAVLRQIQETLQTSGIAHEATDDGSVRVTSTGTKARVRGCGPVAIVSFDVLDTRCKKERFLIEMLTKYLRFINSTV